ncbi:MAG: iron-only hydrogenase system regulator [Lentisphaeria bacterium]|nr:iron-only hydrogenase system regulator [Lentisphaeria bacterium]
MKKRIGVIAILVEGHPEAIPLVNSLLTDFGDIIIGRLGLPYRDRGVSIISLTVEGTTDQVGALSGKLGMIEGVQTKALLLSK